MVLASYFNLFIYIHKLTLTISRIFFYTCDSFHITKHLFIVNIFIIIIRAALIAAMSDLISNE